jgi:hypothetical protein
MLTHLNIMSCQDREEGPCGVRGHSKDGGVRIAIALTDGQALRTTNREARHGAST